MFAKSYRGLCYINNNELSFFGRNHKFGCIILYIIKFPFFLVNVIKFDLTVRDINIIDLIILLRLPWINLFIFLFMNLIFLVNYVKIMDPKL